jgi:uncharacterized membrane protein
MYIYPLVTFDTLDIILQLDILLKSSNILLSSNIRIPSYPHFTMKKTIFIAAMLAVATVLAAGLTVLPSSVQEAQANPCATESVAEVANSGDGDSAAAGGDVTANDDLRDCTFIGLGNINIDWD